tara:strand:+ start:473 stop:937 length:465 start_codon:yes stop_codon:yes gene_type:complete
MDLKKQLLHIENHGYYGFNRRMDVFRDGDANIYEGVIYILSYLWNGDESEKSLLIEELENKEIVGDLDFAFMEFTYSKKEDSLIDRETEDAMDFEFLDSKEDETFFFRGRSDIEGLIEVFAKDVKTYGKSLEERFDLKNIEKGIIKTKENNTKG